MSRLEEELVMLESVLSLDAAVRTEGIERWLREREQALSVLTRDARAARRQMTPADRAATQARFDQLVRRLRER